MTPEVKQRCIELSEEAKAIANSWIPAFANDYSGKVMFTLAVANAVMVMRSLVPCLGGCGQDFIDKVKEGTALWVEMGEPKRLGD